MSAVEFLCHVDLLLVVGCSLWLPSRFFRLYPLRHPSGPMVGTSASRGARYQRSGLDSRLVAYPIKVASHPRRTGAALIVDPPGPVPSVRTQARFPGRLCTKRINNLDSASRTAHSQSQPCDQRGFCLAPYPTVSGVMHLLSRWGALYMRVLLLSIGNLIIICVLTTVKLAGTIRSYEQR